MTKDDIWDFVKSKKYTVISTATAGGVESALMGFGETDEYEIIFGTSNKSRKYKNLKANNNVSLVFGLGDGLQTVQYEGEAMEVLGDDLEKYTSMYHKKVPSAAKFKDLPDQSYWVVKPVWMKFTDVSTEPLTIFEFSFK